MNYSKDNYLDKFEFQIDDNKKKTFIYQNPSQILMRNYISKYTPYESLLLFHALGTGKTLAAISIAEGFREYLINLGRKIIVLVKNKNIQRNFMNELLSGFTGNEYITEEERKIYFGPEIIGKEALVNKINKTINKTYSFVTYGSFVNSVLGMKEYVKDSFNRNTSVVKKENGTIKRINNNVLQNLNNSVIIVDEAHNITNNDVYIALKTVLSRSYNYKLVLLTATPMYDNPREIFEISNLLNCTDTKLQLPIRNDLFKENLLVRKQSQYIHNNILKGGVISITEAGLEKLKRTLSGKVSYLRANTDTNPQSKTIGLDLIPNRLGTSNVVYCKMSKYQMETYIKALKTDINKDGAKDITGVHNIEATENVNQAITLSKTGSLYKNSSDASTIVYPDNTYGKDGYYKIFDDSEKLRNEFRNVLTTDLEKYSCKLHALLNNVKNSPGTVFIYSNYVNYGGTSIIKHVLNINGYTEYPGKEDYSYIMYDESNNVNQRENLRRLFNSSDNKNGKNIKIIIGSPIISEGITLKNVRQVHILEPCWNMSRINQIIGRAIRNNSHADLTPEQRNVDIFKYVSVYPRIKNDDNENSLLRFFIDREKYILSEEKDRANKKIERLLKEISFDCSFMLDRNSISEEYSGLAICDYTNCKYLCNKDHVKNEDGKLERSDKSDKSTYNLYIDFFNKEDIKWIKLIIEKLFKIYFIWTISDIFEHIKKLEPYVTREAVITTLELLITNKTILVDMYNRDGFLIKRGDYYIFNGLDIDIESSIYEKFFNFEVDVNKYTLLDYANSVNLDVEIKEKVVKKKQQLVDIDPEIVTYNDNLMTKTGIIGSRRARGIKNSYGPIDNDFRIIDLRNEKGKETVDNRKIITGMRLISFKKAQLLDFAKYLNIPNIDEDDKGVDIGTSIEKFLTKNNLVLK